MTNHLNPAAPTTNISTPDALHPGLNLVAAALRSPAAAVLALPIVPTDLPGLGPLWETIATIAAAGEDPAPMLVADRLEVAGHLGDQLRSRLVAAVALPFTAPEQLPGCAAAVLAAGYRSGWESFAHALLSAAETGAEGECEKVAQDFAAAQRELWTRLHAARALAGGAR